MHTLDVMRPRDHLKINLLNLMATHPVLNTIEKVCRASGVSKGVVERMTKAQANTGVDHLQGVAHAFGVDIKDLLSTAPAKQEPPQSAIDGRNKQTKAEGPKSPGQRFDSVTDDEIRMLESFRRMSDDDQAELTAEMEKRAAKWAELVAKVLAQTQARESVQAQSDDSTPTGEESAEKYVARPGKITHPTDLRSPSNPQFGKQKGRQ